MSSRTPTGGASNQGAAGGSQRDRTIGDEWWRREVVYQVYPRSFVDSNGDGIGDLDGVRSRVDHFSWLGVGAVWLSPFYPSGGVDNGYDVANYCAVDPVYGTLDQFDTLVDRLHRSGIRVIIDQIYNHSSDEHPWFTASRSSVTDNQRDWYIWRPPRRGHRGGEPGAEPNDWQSFFGGPAWTFDAASGEYYLHLFHRKQPDLNWTNRDLREAVRRAMQWWLDRDVDGLRLDVINLIAKPAGLPDAASHPDLLAMLSANPALHSYLAALRTSLGSRRTGPPTLIGEMPGASADVASLATSTERGELDMAISFDHVELDRGETKWDRVPFPGGRLGTTLAKWQLDVGQTGWNALYLSSHDQPRAVSRFGDDEAHRARSAKTLATVLHLHRGTPVVYQGEEAAMANYPFSSLDEVRDVESMNYAADALAGGARREHVLDVIGAVGRDNARTPVQWDGSHGGGFSHADPWISMNPDHVDWNIAVQRGDGESVLHHYRWLVALRRRWPIVADGTFEPLVWNHPQVYAFVRELGAQRLVVVANLSDAGTPAPDLGVETLDLIHSNPDVELRTSPIDVLEPWESRVWIRRVDGDARPVDVH
ncbi:MAG: alpha-glucosidase [Actinomycetota bacterium]